MVPRDFLPVLPPAEVDALVTPFRAKMAPLDAEVAALAAENGAIDKQIAEATAQVPRPRRPTRASSKGSAGRRPHSPPRWPTPQNAGDALAATAPRIELAYAVAEGTPHDARIQRRGDPKTLGAEVPRHFPLILGGQALPPGTPGSGRRQLADWLTDPRNPLTARVMVNRLWHYHFGRGIVATPSDFGRRGRPRPIPNCSTGSQPGSSSRAGRSRRCIGP